jgi:chromosomal replication initiation ATPase DnaA
MSRITFEIPQNKHPFIGMGTGIIITENGKEEPKIVIKFPKQNVEIIVATGDKAKAMIAELNSDEYYNDSKAEIAKKVACEILEIEPYMLQIKSKDEKPVFGRWMVWRYAHKFLGMSLNDCGEMFGLDHSTAFYGIDKLNEEDLKYLSSWQSSAYREFKRRIEHMYTIAE